MGDLVVCGGELSSRVSWVDEEEANVTEKQICEHVSTNTSINNNEKDKLHSLLTKYSDIFITNPKNPPKAKLVSHVIETGNSQPVRDKMRRFALSWIEEIDKQIEEMLKNGICRKSNSPWSSQVLLVRKKDGTMRFVIDYRKLNDSTKPNVKDLIDDLKGSQFFSCMDLPSVYWHVPMEESSIEKTAFDIPKGKFEMLRMPCGLKNLQATQQRYMDETLKMVPNTSAYVDNILTHSLTFQEHLNHLEQCFIQLQKNNLSLRVNKCDFAKKEIEQFGFIISTTGISPSGENVEKLKKYPKPKCVKEMKRFIGMANYYREFIHKFAEKIEQLQELLRKWSQFVWTETREKIFNQIKVEISSECVLNFPDWNKPFIIELDASKVAACGVLMQDREGKRVILSYHSLTLNSAQRNYSPTEMECLAAISACRCFHAYIKGAPKIILISDHQPLKWLRCQRDTRGKFSRWIMELEQYHYEFEYKPGIQIPGPDALSRIDTGRTPTDDVDNYENQIYVAGEVYNVNDKNEWKQLLQVEQSRGTTIKAARDQLEENNNIKLGRFKNYKQMLIQDDLVVKSGRILVPHSLKFQILEDFHNHNHWGEKNTYVDIAKKYYWPNMRNYIQEFCATCDTRLQGKHPNTKPKTYLKPQQWTECYPRQAIALGIATLIPSFDGYRYVLLIVDGMSKFVELCPMRNITAHTVVKNIKREWIARHGAPETLLPDQGTQVDREEIRRMCEEYDKKEKIITIPS